MVAPIPNVRSTFAACSGCSLCLLVCPVWRRTRDLRFTPHGRAKALQNGVPVAELKDSIDSCTMCGACEPVCPENIDLVAMTQNLRAQLPQPPLPAAPAVTAKADYHGKTVLLAGRALRDNAKALERAVALLGCVVAADDGDDISLTEEAGAPLAESRRAAFLQPLRDARQIIVADGLLCRTLQRWQPRANIVSLGLALSRRTELRRHLEADDLYVIEPRAYHADVEGLVRYYDDLRHETGCAMNLDLQRIAIPATARNLRQRLGLEPADDTAQTRWLLQGRKIARIVVEDAGDIAVFKQVGNLPVVHLAELGNESA
jgi:heterodisulfide reductase subunit C